jgi:hypothetical protein
MRYPPILLSCAQSERKIAMYAHGEICSCMHDRYMYMQHMGKKYIDFLGSCNKKNLVFCFVF